MKVKVKEAFTYIFRKAISAFSSLINSKNGKYKKRGLQKRAIKMFTLIRKIVTLFLLYTAGVTVFYFISNYQEFSDRSILIIIKTASYACILLLFFSFISLVLAITFIILLHKFKRRVKSYHYYILHSVFMLLFITLAAALLLFYNSVTLLSGGVQ